MSNRSETIFSGSTVTFNGADVNTNLRFTTFFHTSQLFHFDVAKFMGLYTGIGIRNIGLITDDVYQNVGFLDVTSSHLDYNKDAKIKRRSYTLGVPFALKLGSMGKKIYFYGGGEYEWTFHYKQKLFIDGEKFKYSEWVSDRVTEFLPSVFAGVQLPKGFNIKFKYYLDNFLNPNFTGVDFGENVDYSTFGKTNIFYVSLSFSPGG